MFPLVVIINLHAHVVRRRRKNSPIINNPFHISPSSTIATTQKKNRSNDEYDDDDDSSQAKETITTTTAKKGATGVAIASSISKQRSTKRRKENEELSSSLPISSSLSSLPSSNNRRKRVTEFSPISLSGAVDPIVVINSNICGLCGSVNFLCRCTGIEYGRDYIYVDLPPPSVNSGQRQLIKRWISLIACNPATENFAGDQWYSDNIDQLIESMVQRKREFHGMVQDYIVTLSNSVKLSQLARAVIGGPLANINTMLTQHKVDVVTSEITTSYEIFMCGDWACLTFIGNLLLLNAFQTSNEEKYSRNDPQLRMLLEDGVYLIDSLLSKAYDYPGYHLAMEYDRPPLVGFGSTFFSGTTIIPSASDRLTRR